MSDKKYKCAHCQQIFKYDWTDEEANKEAKEIWGVKNASTDNSMAIVCDDCYKKIMGIKEQA